MALAQKTTQRPTKGMADLLGESPNLLDDLFKDLEDWEAILNSLPDFGVDQNADASEGDEFGCPET